MRYALAALAAFMVALGVIAGTQAAPPVSGNETTSFVNAQTLTNTGGVAITSAVTGKRQVIKGFALASDTAGVVALLDGEGGDTIGVIYFAQDTTLVMDPEDIGEGIKSSSGNAIYASNNGAVLNGLLRLKTE